MRQYAITAILVATCSLANSAQAETGIRWSELPPLPDKHGLAGAFAGTCDGVLLVAGGANFPDKMPWDGGQKVWHDNVYAIDHPYGKWKVVGKLSQPLGYGVSFSTDDGIVCIGGSDANRHYSNCFLLRLKNGELITSPLPSLPHPCANFSGAVIGTKIYIAGGTETPTSTKALQTFWGLDLHDQKAGWQVLEPWPGPGRMLSVVAVQRQSFYLCSGAELTADLEGKAIRHYLRDAYCFHPDRGWNRVADLPRPAVAAPSPAPPLDDARFVVIGGDDGSLVSLHPQNAHPGFPKTILAYQTKTDHWDTVGEAPAAPVTTPIVHWNELYVIPSGELRPGVRTPAVRTFQMER